MKQRYLVICDSEEAYARRLMHYLSRSRILDAQIRMVQSPLEAERIGREAPIGILLISETFPVKERQQVNAELVLVLTGDGGEKPVESEFEIRKYQPGRKILKDIANITLENEREGVFHHRGSEKTKLCGVYSPFPAARQHTVAYRKAVCEAKKKKILYIDARIYGGLTKNKETLADLIY